MNCPYCGSGPVQRERRPDGHTHCLACGAFKNHVVWDAAVAAARQLPPRPGTRDVVPLVVADLAARAAAGRAKYGRPLQTHNGRNALLDAYQEALDLACYLKQALLEAEEAR